MKWKCNFKLHKWLLTLLVSVVPLVKRLNSLP